MALKPNYNQQRAERNRAKQEKKDRKQRELQERKAAKVTGDGDDIATGTAENDGAISEHS